MRMKYIGIAAWLLASTLGLHAQVFEVSPFFGYRFGGSFNSSNGEATSLQDGRAYGLSLDYTPYPSDIKLELFWSRQNSGLNLEGVGGLNHLNMTVDEFMLGGIYEHGWGRLRETVTVLVGATLFDPDSGESEARFAFGIGVGVKYFLMKNLALRADLRGYCTVVESDSAFISTGGVTVVYFSGSSIWQGEVSGGLTFSF
jgi:hypothetical protein